MNKRVTTLLAMLLVLALAVSGTALCADASSAQEVEKEIKVKIEKDESDGENYYWIDDGNDDVKIVKVGKEGAFMGINMEDLTENIRKELGYKKDAGVLVTGVVEGSAAEKHGLREKDVIYTFDGEKVLGAKHLSELVGEKKPGDRVKIVYYRDGKKMESDLELGEREYKFVKMDYDYYGDAAKKYALQANKLSKHLAGTYGKLLMHKGRLGVVLHDLSDDLASYFDVKNGEGALVTDVVEEGPAEKAGVKAGDVIVSVGGESISSSSDVVEKLSGFDEETVTLGLVRKGKTMELKVELDEDFSISPFPGEHMKMKVEIPEIPPYEVLLLDKKEKLALEKEIEALRAELKMLEKRLEKMEKE